MIFAPVTIALANKANVKPNPNPNPNPYPYPNPSTTLNQKSNDNVRSYSVAEDIISQAIVAGANVGSLTLWLHHWMLTNLHDGQFFILITGKSAMNSYPLNQPLFICTCIKNLIVMWSYTLLIGPLFTIGPQNLIRKKKVSDLVSSTKLSHLRQYNLCSYEIACEQLDLLAIENACLYWKTIYQFCAYPNR